MILLKNISVLYTYCTVPSYEGTTLYSNVRRCTCTPAPSKVAMYFRTKIILSYFTYFRIMYSTFVQKKDTVHYTYVYTYTYAYTYCNVCNKKLFLLIMHKQLYVYTYTCTCSCTCTVQLECKKVHVGSTALLSRCPFFLCCFRAACRAACALPA